MRILLRVGVLLAAKTWDAVEILPVIINARESISRNLLSTRESLERAVLEIVKLPIGHQQKNW